MSEEEWPLVMSFCVRGWGLGVKDAGVGRGRDASKLVQG